MAQYRSPPPLNFQEPKYEAWKSQFMTFRLVTKLHKDDDEVQVASLKYCMGPESEEIMKTFSLSEGDKKKFEIVLKKFDEYFKPKVNVIRMRRIFQRRVQQSTENEETYMRALYSAAEDCCFDDLKKERIRDQFICGLQDERLAEKLEHLYMNNTTNFTLDRVLEFTRTYCDIKEGRKQEKQLIERENVDAVSKRISSPDFQSNNYNRYKSNPYSSTKRECGFCGLMHGRESCPAYGKKCVACGKNNHFARVCRQKSPRRNIQEITQRNFRQYYDDAVQGDENEDPLFLGECLTNVDNNKWNVDIKFVGDISIRFKVDTGADVTIMNYQSFNGLTCENNILPSNKKLITPAGELKYLGVINANICYKNVFVRETIYVMPREVNTNNLLGREAAQKLNIVKFIGDINDDSLFGFGCWQTEPVQFHIKNDSTPYAIHSARRIPFHLMKLVKEALQKMVSDDIIESVSAPTEWASAIVPVMKPGKKKVRICVDFRNLNKRLKREVFHIPTFDELSSKLAGVKIMSKLDAASGFFQIPLDENARNYTTFLTPFGRYRFKRLPMGVNTAPEIYQRKMCELLEGIDGVLVYMDDVIVFGNSEQSHEKALRLVLDRIKQSGLKLNKEKCEFSKNSLEFLGHTISSEGIKASPSKIEAIQKLKTPTNVAELRRVLGLVNFVTKFIHKAQVNLIPLNELLRKSSVWQWNKEHDDSFNKIKVSLCEAPALAYFDPNKEIIVSADASSYAMGGVLLQKHGTILRPVAYCSRAFNNSEQNYAQIEKELLAAVWTCEKFETYLQGIEFVLQSDHKPLIPLINNKNLLDAPLRCQRLLMRLSRYSPLAEYIPGKFMVVADTLSRDVECINNIEDSELCCEVNEYEIQAINSFPFSQTKLQFIITEQIKDEMITKVKQFTIDGWPNIDVNKLSDYYIVRSQLSVVNNLLILGNRIVIPHSMRRDILTKIHDDGHLSLQKCRERVKESVWWPRISTDLAEYIERCSFCQINRRRNHCEPLRPTQLPDRPWQQLAIDIFELRNERFLIVVDYYSRWFEVVKLHMCDSESVINALKVIFSTFGIPDIIKSDRALSFTSFSFKNFARDYDFVHYLSDPYYPQGNGCAERAVQVAKRLYKQADPLVALMAYRSTPLETTGYSPAQLLMGRNIRTQLPVLPLNLIPNWPDMKEVQVNDENAKIKSAKYFNQRKGARVLSQLKEGQDVRVRLPKDKEWNTPQKLLFKNGETSYAIRNRRYLIPLPDEKLNEDNNKNVNEDTAKDVDSEINNDDQQCHPDVPLPIPAPPTSENIVNASPADSNIYKTRYGRSVKPVVRFGC